MVNAGSSKALEDSTLALMQYEQIAGLEERIELSLLFRRSRGLDHGVGKGTRDQWQLTMIGALNIAMSTRGAED